MFHRLVCFILLCYLPFTDALATPAYQINTLGGTGDSGFSGDGGAGIAAMLASPHGVAADAQGHLYIADKYNHRIRKIAPDGSISTVAGTGAAGYSGDGAPAIRAQLNTPLDVAVDAQGRVYVVDHGNHCIRSIDTSGIIQRLAGQCGAEGSVNDGKPARSAYLRRPSGIGIDAAGTVYIADSGNHRIRKVTADGIIQRVAGENRNGGYSGDGGAAIAANLRNPLDVASDTQGNVYIADTDNHRIRKIDSNGRISTIAGAHFGYTGDGSAAKYALLYKPSSLAIDGQNRLLIADSYNHRIRLIDAQDLIHTVAGSGLSEIGNGGFFGDDVLAGRARLFNPQGLGVDAQGRVFVADANNHRVRKLSPVSHVPLIESFVGARATGLKGGGFSGDGGAAKEAQLKQVEGVATDAQGSLYIADSGNHRIRKVTTEGVIETLVGGEKGSQLGGGDPLAAQLNMPIDVMVDTSGSVFIADFNNHRVLKLDAQGVLSLFAGNGQKGAGGDGGAAHQAQLNRPMGLALGADGSLFIADSGNEKVRKVDSNGVISTVAGNGQAGSSGDGGQALQARLKMPTDVAVDAAGHLYIADRKNYRIRKVDRHGIISTVAGSGAAGYGSDGAALSQRIDEPNGLVFDAQGHLYFSERNTDRVRKLTADGEIISVAGTGGLGFSGDGDPALTALMHAPSGVAIDPRNGDLFIADSYNHRVRRVYTPSVQLSLEISGDGRVSLSASSPHSTGESETHYCHHNCTYFYPPNSRLSLQAEAAAGSEFKGWEGCAETTDTQLELDLAAVAKVHPERVSSQSLGTIRCQAMFVAQAAPLEPEPPAEPPPELPPETPETPAQPQPTVVIAALTSRQDCAGIEQAASLDLSASPLSGEGAGQAVIEQINALPVFENGALLIRQDRQQGYLMLEQAPLRLAVQPLVARFSDQPLGNLNDALQIGLQQETLLRLPQSDGTVLDVFAQPALQDLCALQEHTARLGYPHIRVKGDGNLRISQTNTPNSPWLSLRPDWIATAITQEIPDGLLFSATLLANRYPSLSLIFTDSEGQKRQQFFYPVPADLAALQDAVENLTIQPFAPWRFSWAGNSYVGIWQNQVQPGESAAAFNIDTVADLNGDGVADYRVTFPSGEQQLFFQEGTDE